MQVSLKVDDEEIAAALDDAESKSEFLRDAARLKIREEAGREFPELDDDCEVAYNWLLDNVGVGNRAEVKQIETRLAIHLSLDKDLIRAVVLRPLEAAGCVRPAPGVRSAFLVVKRPPWESVEDDEETSSESDDVADGGGDVGPLEEQRERLESAEPARADGGESA